MQNFFVAAADGFKPVLLRFRNPLAVLLPHHGGSSRRDERIQSQQQLRQLARDVEKMQPGLAAELRGFATRA